MPNSTNRSTQLHTLLTQLNLAAMAGVCADVALRAAKEGLAHEASLYWNGNNVPNGAPHAWCGLQAYLRRKPFGPSHSADSPRHCNCNWTVLKVRLPQELSKLDKFACVILDDIGYVQQDRDEMEVLFTFLAERYERKSVMITTNLVFSEWERIFKNPMTTMAAIDRLVHHSVILDMMSVESYRAEEALQQHLSSAHPKKPSSGRTLLHEAVPALRTLDASCTSPHDDLSASANEQVPITLVVAENPSRNPPLDDTTSAGLIATNGTV